MIRRDGFTLLEIMIAIMIFSIVTLAMVSILLLSSEIFRRGEYGRSAHDEAVAVLAAIEDDLSRVVPARDGGFIACDVSTAAGDTVLALLVDRRDRTLVGTRGVIADTRGPPYPDLDQGREIVVWLANDPSGAAPADRHQLLRATCTAPVETDPADDEFYQRAVELVTWMQTPSGTPPPGAPAAPAVVVSGCLHFGASLSNEADRRDLTDSGQSVRTWARTDLLPTVGVAYSTDVPVSDPFPCGISIAVTLTGGGRHAPRGTLVPLSGASISATDNRLRVAGIKGVSAVPGSWLRIDDEWVCYASISGDGIVDCTPDPSLPTIGRGARRSVGMTHNRGTDVLFGQTYTLVRPLPY
ncbi:MAG: prepilin-type N-terminal cleavage/methylation domain-containing protein [Planctomycetes bacterium]|nr:prepilin-type N-terminal cleavage/methylation domain-containing protein [Planctomycetota bacterium]